MDTRTLSASPTGIVVSGGDADHPLSWEYIINHASTTNGLHYVVDNDFPHIIRMLVHTTVGASAYWQEDNYSVVFAGLAGLVFQSTCTYVGFSNHVFIRTGVSLLFLGSASTTYNIDGFTIQITDPAANSEALISMQLSILSSSSTIRNFNIVTEPNSLLGALARFEYNFPDSEKFSVNLINVTASPHTTDSEGRITIEGNGASNVAEGNPYILSNSNSSSSSTFENITFISRASTPQVTVFAATTRAILVNPLIYFYFARERRSGGFNLIDAVGATVEVRKTLFGQLYDHDGTALIGARIRIFHGTHIYVPSVTSMSSNSTGGYGGLLEGVYEVTPAGTVTNRLEATARIRIYGYIPIEKTILIDQTEDFHLTTYMTQDPITASLDAVEIATDMIVSVNAITRVITKGAGANKDPRFIYGRYNRVLAENANMIYKHYMTASEGFYELNTGEDDTFTININGDCYTTEEEELGTVLKSNGDIVLSSTVQCNILLEYVRSSIAYSSMLIDLLMDSETSTIEDFTRIKYNVRYKRVSEAGDPIVETTTFVSVADGVTISNRVTDATNFVFQFPKEQSGEDTLTVTERAINFTIMDPLSYISVHNYPVDEFSLQTQQINLQSIPGFRETTFADLLATHTAAIANGTWAYETTGDVHTLTMTNVGIVNVHVLASFLQYSLYQTPSLYAHLDRHPFTYADNVLDYQNLDVVANGTSEIDDDIRLFRFRSLSGTNRHNQNINGSVRIRVVNENITSFKISVINTDENSVLVDFTTINSSTYSYHNLDQINCRAVIYAEGYIPRTVNFNTNTFLLLDVLLVPEVDINYQLDIGRMNINASNTVVSLSREGTGNSITLQIDVEPANTDDVILSKDQSLTFFGLIKGHNDYLSILRDFDFDNIIAIEEDRIVDEISKFTLNLTTVSGNLGSYVHLTINIHSDNANFDDLNSHNRRVYYESLRETCDSAAIIGSIQTSSGCATLEEARAIFI